MRELKPWEERLVIPDADWVSLPVAAECLGVGSARVTNWVHTERLQRAYSSRHEVGVTRASLDKFEAFRAGASPLRKLVFAVGTFIRLM